MFGINKLKLEVSELESIARKLMRDVESMKRDLKLIRDNQYSDEHDWFVDGVGYLRKMVPDRQSPRGIMQALSNNVPQYRAGWHYRYTTSHEWIKVEGNQKILDAIREIEEEEGGF